jgi:5'-3' exonuclease
MQKTPLRASGEQVLSGDSTDNIGGVWKLGPKKAKALVDEWYSKEPPRTYGKASLLAIQGLARLNLPARTQIRCLTK